MGSILWGLECFLEKGGCSMVTMFDNAEAGDGEEVNDFESTLIFLSLPCNCSIQPRLQASLKFSVHHVRRGAYSSDVYDT